MSPLDVRPTFSDHGICPDPRLLGVQRVYDGRTVPRLSAAAFVVLAIIAACGGKVLTGESSGGNGGSTGEAGYGVGGYMNPGTTTVGVGGAVGSPGGGGATSCGIAVCGPGQFCCNSQCGICGDINGGCPQIACGTGGGFGAGGAF